MRLTACDEEAVFLRAAGQLRRWRNMKRHLKADQGDERHRPQLLGDELGAQASRKMPRTMTRK